MKIPTNRTNVLLQHIPLNTIYLYASSIARIITNYIWLCALLITPLLATGIFHISVIQQNIPSVIDITYIKVALITTAFTGAGYAYIFASTYFLIIIKDLRLMRLLHYYSMLLLGLTLGLSHMKLDLLSYVEKHTSIIFDCILLLISIGFSWVFAIICNNIADLDIDIISNPNRPLVKNEISIYTYKRIGFLALTLSMLFATFVSVKAYMFIAITIFIYYTYSTPPIRFKRVPYFSKLAISGNSLLFILLGYFMIIQNFTSFPISLIFIYLFGYTTAANFIDIKDISGDKNAKIATLPVLFGAENAKKIIGLGFLATSLSYHFLFHQILLIPLLLIIGIIHYILINQKKYKEWPVLAFSLFNTACVILYYLFPLTIITH